MVAWITDFLEDKVGMKEADGKKKWEPVGGGLLGKILEFFTILLKNNPTSSNGGSMTVYHHPSTKGWDMLLHCDLSV